MEELTLDGKIYVSSKRAAAITGYAKDYVGQLCREGRVEARLVGRNWYILEASIREHRFAVAAMAAEEEKEPVEEVAAANPGTWEAPSYRAEEPTILPVQQERELRIEHDDEQPLNTAVEALAGSFEEVVEREQEFAEPRIEMAVDTSEIGKPMLPNVRESYDRDTSEVIDEMHSVWKDWFSHKAARESDEIPVPIRREVARERPEPVAFDIQPASVTQSTLAAQEMIHQPAFQKGNYIAPDAIPAGRIIRERRIKRKAKANPFLQFFFVLIIVIAISVGVLGTGFINISSIRDMTIYKPLSFILGQVSFSHS